MTVSVRVTGWPFPSSSSSDVHLTVGSDTERDSKVTNWEEKRERAGRQALGIP